MTEVSSTQRTRKFKSLKPFLLANLAYLHSQKRIWLNPEYQRESVWTRSQKQLLIDSLLRDIDIPKLYFRKTSHRGFDYEVVDGQQRLRAVFEYLANGFSLEDDADPVEGHSIAACAMKDLHMDLQLKLNTSPLDVVILESGYTDDDVEDIFTRLQNGTPLNAAEKRRALPSKMREVVESLAHHKLFKNLSGFTGRRFAYEDAVAKPLHLLLAGAITDIKHASIRKTYESHSTITLSHPKVTRLKKAFDFLVRAFKNHPSPKFKKHSIVTLGYLVPEMLDAYDLSSHATEFATAYLEFEKRRILNAELDEDDQDSRLSGYTSAARADRVQDMEYRHETLRREIVAAIPELATKDPNRQFTDDQRLAIFLRDGGSCRVCGLECEQGAFHADHKKPFSRGGATTIANGQLLCISCNLKKGGKKVAV